MQTRDFELREPHGAKCHVSKVVQLHFNNERELVEKFQRFYGYLRLERTTYKFKTPGLSKELSLCNGFKNINLDEIAFVE